MASRSTTQTPKISSTEGTSRPAAAAVKSAAKASAAKAEKSTATATRAPRKNAVSPGNAIQLTPEERQRYVSEAAFFIAERRGFGGGCEFDDWLQAEAQIDQLLAGTTRH